MKLYVSDITSNKPASGKIVGYFLVGECVSKVSKINKEYLILSLADKTGTLDARLWSVPIELESSKTSLSGKVVKVAGELSSWNDQPQLSISNIRVIGELSAQNLSGEAGQDLFEDDFIKMSAIPPKELFETLSNSAAELLQSNSPTAMLYSYLLQKYEQELLKAPAAKGIHHGYVGGLLEHILGLTDAAVLMSDLYDLDKELMILACLAHDIGKIKELKVNGSISYTPEGTLLGHIYLGCDMVSRGIDWLRNAGVDFPEERKMQILHVLLSHHGRLEWGSPKLPMMREAIVFHHLDMIDSQMQVIKEAAESGTTDGFTKWIKPLERPIYVANDKKGDDDA